MNERIKEHTHYCHKKCEHNHEEHHSCSCHSHSETSCSCHHHDENQRILILRLVSGAIMLSAAIFTRITPLFFAAYLIPGYDVLINAVKDLKNLFNESFLMSIASLGAFAIGEHSEAAAVMLLYQLGEFLSHRAAGKSKNSITALMDLRIDRASVLQNGEFITLPCEKIKVGDTIRVSAGEKIPLDGIIFKGNAYLDTSALTGEAMPVPVQVGDNVLSGSICTDSVIEIQVTKEFSESTVSKILSLVSSKNSSESERFISKFARTYTPVVVLAAICICTIPSIITGDWQKWIYTALTFLMVSCPCALVISIPLTFVAGIGSASKKGILLKGSYALEKLAKIKQAAFDKTGTLTEGKFAIEEIVSSDANELLKFAAHAEYFSSHPIAKAITSGYKETDVSAISDYREVPGKGVSAIVCGKTVLVGTQDFTGADISVKNAVYVSIDGKFAGYITLYDKLKSTSSSAISYLRHLKIDSIMLTGDSDDNARRIAEELAIPYHASLLPQDKAEFVKKSAKTTAFIGDGINDAPVLSCADIGISMGGIGSDAAIEASDAVIMTDDPEKVAEAVKTARRTMKILRENVIFAITIKLLIMILGIFGLVTMWAAVFVDVGVSLLSVLNAMRAYKD